mgnify:CR=1 FL=1
MAITAKHYFFLILGLTLLFGCAQFTNISGGTADTTPPRLIEEKTFPKNKSTNFSSSRIELRFDEYFTLSNPQQKVFVSPSLTKDPDYKVRGKSLIIDLNNTLAPNTTYTINFGDAIKDLNANNILTNFTYVFSTGDYIDSLFAFGKVTDAKSGSPSEGITVGLYNSFDDSIVSKEMPIYFAQTDKSGRFSFQNLKGGRYKVFALKDENRNYLFDLPNEKVGFLDSTIRIDTSKKKDIEIKLFEQNFKKQSIVSKSYEYPGKLMLVYNKPIDSAIYRLLNSTIEVKKQVLNEANDSLILWLNNPKEEKFKIELPLDSIIDTITIYPFKKPKDTTLKIKKTSLSMDVNDKVNLTFVTPILAVDTTKIEVKKDSSLININGLKIDSIDTRKLTIDFNKSSEANYRILFLPKAITDIYGRQNEDTAFVRVKTYEEGFYGTLSVALDSLPEEADIYLEIVQKDNTIKRVRYTNEVVFNEMIPGKYMVKVLVDENKNGSWDTGNYYQLKQPERIVRFEKSIEIRSNWEVKERFSLK